MTLHDYFIKAGLGSFPFAERIALRWPPFNHQIEDLHFLAQHTRSKLLNEMGTGKTLPVQAYGLWLVGQGNKVVYTMPPVLVQQFHDSFASTYLNVDEQVSRAVLAGPPKQREALLHQWDKQGHPDILTLSYRMFVLYHEQLKQSGYTCVIVDEATALKTPSSQLHQAVKKFAGNCRKDSNGVVLMTGTPVETNPIDAYGLVAIVDPDWYGSKKTFERVHCIKSDDGRIVGYKNFETLNNALMDHGRRVLKSQVTDLPPRLITEIPVSLSSKHIKLYRKLVDERIAEIGDRVIDMTEQSAIYQGLQRVLMCPERFTDQQIDNNLLEALDTLLEELDGRKVVVYAWYQETIEKLQKRYASRKPAVLYGKTVGSKRDAQKRQFIEDPNCTLIIANPRSGGVGVDGFQHVSSHVVFAEVCPFVGVFQQATDRLHRTGQSDTVNVYLLVPAGTIAVKLRNDLVRKDTQQELAVRDRRCVLAALLGEEGIKGSLDDVDRQQRSREDTGLQEREGVPRVPSQTGQEHSSRKMHTTRETRGPQPASV